MKYTAYATVFVCVFLMAAGQGLFKLAANGLSMGGPWSRAVLVPALSAGSIYALATVAWIWSLQYIPLSKAFPVFALSFAIVPAVGWLFFNERPGAQYFLGLFLILGGVFLTVSDN